jgi:Holliday junction DNA helicase RuvB
VIERTQNSESTGKAASSVGQSPVAPTPEVAELTQYDAALRPETLAEYVGQEQLKGNLQVFLQAAQQRGESFEHTLFAGPPGLGKTTLAQIIARELGVSLRLTTGPALERAGDLAAILTSLQPHDVLFIDEIHRLRTVVEETLYTALEDFALDLVLGKGPTAKTCRLTLPPFTLIGATTQLSGLSAPLRDRFGHHFQLEYYTPEQLTAIILRSAGKLGVAIDQAAAERLAASARFTPRIANRLLRRMRDFAEVRHAGKVTLPVVEQGLASLGVDALGLDAQDQAVLRTLILKFAGGPVGVSTLAAATSISAETIENVIEPFLLRLGFLQRTPRGRLATPAAAEHLGIAA